MINNIADIMNHLTYIGNKVNTDTSVFLIQGSALLWHELKDSTNDIDICCGYEETNRIVAAIRQSGRMETVTGAGGVMFLRFFLKEFVLWCAGSVRVSGQTFDDLARHPTFLTFFWNMGHFGRMYHMGKRPEGGSPGSGFRHFGRGILRWSKNPTC